MRRYITILLVMNSVLLLGQKSKVNVIFTVDPQTDVYAEFGNEIVSIQNTIQDSLIKTLNSIMAYAEFVKTSSPIQLAVKLIRKSTPNKEFDDMYYSGTLGSSGDTDPIHFEFLFTTYNEFNTIREDGRAIRMKLASKFKEYLTGHYDKEPFLDWNTKLPMMISDQRHFSIIGGKYVITLPFNIVQLNIDPLTSRFNIKVDYKNANNSMYLLDENVQSCGNEARDIFIAPNRNLKGCLLIESTKPAAKPGLSGMINFTKYKRGYHEIPKKYNQT